jgi:hypothetical protein
VDRFGCSNLTPNLLAKTSKPFFFGTLSSSSFIIQQPDDQPEVLQQFNIFFYKMTLSKLADLHDYKLYNDQRRFYISVKSTM